MGVMACDRKDCENVMCTRISHRYQWYICDECVDEFIEQCPHQNIELFMKSSKTGHRASELQKKIKETIIQETFSHCEEL